MEALFIDLTQYTTVGALFPSQEKRLIARRMRIIWRRLLRTWVRKNFVEDLTECSSHHQRKHEEVWANNTFTAFPELKLATNNFFRTNWEATENVVTHFFFPSLSLSLLLSLFSFLLPPSPLPASPSSPSLILLSQPIEQRRVSPGCCQWYAPSKRRWAQTQHSTMNIFHWMEWGHSLRPAPGYCWETAAQPSHKTG